MRPTLILASTSPFRKAQLEAFGLSFKQESPKIDEESYKSAKISAKALCNLLSKEKARSILTDHPNDLILGGDQLVLFNGKIIGKPHTRDRAIATLKAMNGKRHQLITSITLIYKQKSLTEQNVTQIQLRKLSLLEIERYIDLDQPLQSAGSYMFEKAGLSLVQKMNCSDPSALIGIPLISLINLAKKHKVELPFKYP